MVKVRLTTPSGILLGCFLQCSSLLNMPCSILCKFWNILVSFDREHDGSGLCGIFFACQLCTINEVIDGGIANLCVSPSSARSQDETCCQKFLKVTVGIGT